MQKALVNYFKSCYQSDYRAISLLNFYSAKVEHSLILESAELLQGKILEFPVPTNWGKKVEQRLAIYSKEKALYYCSFFMFGEMIIAEKNKILLRRFICIKWKGKLKMIFFIFQLMQKIQLLTLPFFKLPKIFN